MRYPYPDLSLSLQGAGRVRTAYRSGRCVTVRGAITVAFLALNIVCCEAAKSRKLVSETDVARTSRIWRV